LIHWLVRCLLCMSMFRGNLLVFPRRAFRTIAAIALSPATAAPA
jgi:hypothetical protein